MTNSPNYKPIISQLKKTQSILFVTGAGISAESGVPTYRGISGLYNNGELVEGMEIEDLMSGYMIRRQPELVWRYLEGMVDNFRQASFNKGHQVIAEMEKHFPRVTVFTQNIDGFHRAAGSQNVIDIHGDIHTLYCTNCDYRTEVDERLEIDFPPLCPKCKDQKILRPDVVFFGEMLPGKKLVKLASEMEQGFDMVFTIGTSALFPYIVGPVSKLKEGGSFAVEINPEDTSITPVVDIKLSLGAGEALDQIWQGFNSN